MGFRLPGTSIGKLTSIDNSFPTVLDNIPVMGHMRGALSSGVLFATVNWMEKGDGPAGSASVAPAPGFARVYPSYYGLGR